jgi:hypothetical protein
MLTGQKLRARQSVVHGPSGLGLGVGLTTPHPEQFNRGEGQDPHRIVAPIKIIIIIIVVV